MSPLHHHHTPTNITTATIAAIPLIHLVLGDVDWQCTPSLTRQSPPRKHGRDWLAPETQESYPLLSPSALCGVERFGKWEISYP